MLTSAETTLNLTIPNRFSKGQSLLNFLAWVAETGRVEEKLILSDPGTGTEVEIANLAKIPDEVFDKWWREWVKRIEARKDRR
jgi:hypothetical protein